MGLGPIPSQASKWNVASGYPRVQKRPLTAATGREVEVTADIEPDGRIRGRFTPALPIRINQVPEEQRFSGEILQLISSDAPNKLREHDPASRRCQGTEMRGDSARPKQWQPRSTIQHRQPPESSVNGQGL